MYLRLWDNLLNQCHNSRIADYEGIYFEILYSLQIILQWLDIFIMSKNVQRKVAFNTARMCEFDALLHFLKGHVSCTGSERKGLSAEVYGICSVKHSYFKFFNVAGRSQQFHFFHLISCENYNSLILLREIPSPQAIIVVSSLGSEVMKSTYSRIFFILVLCLPVGS